MRIIGSTWFTELGSTRTIGIVVIDTGHEFKAYIGTADGHDQKQDELTIANRGAKFPLYDALNCMGLTYEVLCRDG